MSERSRRRTARGVGVVAAAVVWATAGPTVDGRCLEPATAAAANKAGATAELQWQFEARRRLESMGLRGLTPVTAGANASAPGSRAMPVAAQYRSRVVAPTLAFLHGLCDSNGGLPRFGTTVDFAIRAGSALELRASYLGEIATAEGKPSGVWIWDLGKLPENVHTVRVSGGGATR